MRDYKPVSGPGAFEEFMQGSIYKDFINEVDLRIEDMRDVLEEAETKVYHKTQGAIKLARQFREIFNDLCNNSRMDMEEQDDD